MRRSKVLAMAAVSIAAASMAWAQNPSDALSQGFLTPPASALPRTWWHWTNGNVTEEGITKDLEWMKRVGIGGFQLIDVASGGGQTVDKKINFGTPEWYHAVHHTAEEAKRLGLEMDIFSSPGWSEAGGPWVKPEEAMKKLVWSETDIEGPRDYSEKLPEPPSNEGPVRDLAVGPRTGDAPHFYRDSVLIAYRTPADEVPLASLHPKVTTSAGPIDATALLDGSLNTSVNIAAPSGPAWLQFEFPTPYTARALTIGSRGGIPVGRILASDDGTNFRTIEVTPGPQGYHGAPVRTFAFPAATAKFFRIELDGAGLRPAAVIAGGTAVPATEYTLTEAILYSDARVNRWEDQGAFGSLMNRYDLTPTPEASKASEIARGDVIDLSSKLDKDGTLHWQAPSGKWTILRMGYSLTGAKNRPATAAGLGYEVDKLSAKYVEGYFHGYMDPIQEHLGDLSSTLRYMTMDSWEAGMQNWTDEMIAQFRQRRGYDPTPYMPVLAGHVVESADVSDRFLWDFRRTLADMFADNFYGVMDSELKKKGMQAYSEASGVALEIPEDTLLNKSKVDIPMAEFWVHALHPESMYFVDVRGAASAAHIYGKPLVATESFTGGGYESPYTLKKVADYWFAQGVNRLVFHTSAQQPLDTKPGNTMVGTHINRNITWAEQAKPFMTYVSRISWMMQQGSPVMDLAYLLPEGAPSTMPFWGAGLLPAPPKGYDYDYLNTDALLHKTSVSADGRLTLADGMSYRVLVLPPTKLMTPEVLHKIQELVAAGVTIVGPRPTRSPSLRDYPKSDNEIQAMATAVWGDMDGITNIQHVYGKGMAYWGLTLDDVLTRLKYPQDFASGTTLEAAPVWAHRRTSDADIYYIANQADAPQTVDARFRVSGKDVQLWRPMTGKEEEISSTSANGFTTVPLKLDERESVFIIFRHTSSASSRSEPVVVATKTEPVTGPWELTFPAKSGAPASVHSEKLTSWTDSSDAGVKY
ncbi:MAG: glycosyl hydrolase, partial [Caulobacteraceae bacterium]